MTEMIHRVLRAVVITVVTEYVRQRMVSQTKRLDSMNFLEAVESVPRMTVPEVERMSRVMIDISHGIHDFEGLNGGGHDDGEEPNGRTVTLSEFMEEMEKRGKKPESRQAAADQGTGMFL